MTDSQVSTKWEVVEMPARMGRVWRHIPGVIEASGYTVSKNGETWEEFGVQMTAEHARLIAAAPALLAACEAARTEMEETCNSTGCDHKGGYCSDWGDPFTDMCAAIAQARGEA